MTRAEYRLECKIEAISLLAEAEGDMVRSVIRAGASGDDLDTLIARAANMRAVGIRRIMEPELRDPTAIIQEVKDIVLDLVDKYILDSSIAGDHVRGWGGLTIESANKILAIARHVVTERRGA